MHVIGEYYHVYNRGAHKAPIFHETGDYDRFQALLYSANETVRLKPFWDAKEIWVPRKNDQLVEIFAYCLMPNHFHLGLKEVRPHGIYTFMQRICTSHAMYYNKKYGHSGTLFQGSYKSKHIDSDEYLRYVLQYIHLNPYGIKEPELMKSARSERIEAATAYSSAYIHSSFRDYLGMPRIQKIILSRLNL